MKIFRFYARLSFYVTEISGSPNKIIFINYQIYYDKYSKKSYSISNVDLIIGRIFKDISKGIYIDVGCNHPIKFNNTCLLYKRGWHGINVDVDSTSINIFNKMRKNDQ